MSSLRLEVSASELADSGLSFTPFSDTSDQGVQMFRDGMAGLSAAVNVITTMVDGQPAGFTATAVTSVTDAPPTLLVCLNQSSSVFEAFDKAEYLCVNTLAGGQETESGLFASKLSQPERFASVDWCSFITGSPVLASCSKAFDCKIASRVKVGTHEVFFCEILGIGHAEQASSLVYFNRQYHSLS
ncbi:flavin reductase [Thiomicrorhabdus sp.]|uniref:flavin reductase n=1 Tax=Thiomicrorhabdus sp. TaxID=2039724 RepID=UPI0029C957E0|nr:flavin reductase [Thiomicrorhabdus sp.]